jgi:hypothetical protein
MCLLLDRAVGGCSFKRPHVGGSAKRSRNATGGRLATAGHRRELGLGMIRASRLRRQPLQQLRQKLLSDGDQQRTTAPRVGALPRASHKKSEERVIGRRDLACECDWVAAGDGDDSDNCKASWSS